MFPFTVFRSEESAADLLFALGWPSTRGQGSYDGDKPSVFILVDRGMGDRYIVPAKSADESTVRLLLANHDEESLTVYTDGFRVYDPLEDDDEFDRKYVIHGDGDYADDEVHVTSCESHASLTRRWFSPHRGISKDKLTPYLRPFQLRHNLPETWSTSPQARSSKSALTRQQSTPYERCAEDNNVLEVS